MFLLSVLSYLLPPYFSFPTFTFLLSHPSLSVMPHKSLDFSLNRFFMKLFKTSDLEIVRHFPTVFGYELPSVCCCRSDMLNLLKVCRLLIAIVLVVFFCTVLSTLCPERSKPQTLLDRNVKSQRTSTKLCALYLEYIADKTTKFR